MSHAAIVKSVCHIRTELLDLISELGEDHVSGSREIDVLIDELLTAANQLGRVETELSSADRPEAPAPSTAAPRRPYLMPDVGSAPARVELARPRV
jgi:hypothetical protein